MEEFQSLIETYVKSDDIHEHVKAYLTEVAKDDEILSLILLAQGGANKAFEKIKAYAQARFVTYPECFPESFSDGAQELFDRKPVYPLRALDKEGRRILIVELSAWDTEKQTLTDFIVVVTYILEKMLVDKDAMKNGIVNFTLCDGLSMSHVKQLSLNSCRCLLSTTLTDALYVVKEGYYINVPNVAAVALGLIKSLTPTGFKLEISPVSKGYSELEAILPKEKLPKKFGGDLELEDAADLSLYE